MSGSSVVFCADRRVLPGLHVAAHSVLARRDPASAPLRIHVVSDDLTDSDLDLLRDTLSGASTRFQLQRHRVDPEVFRGFPSMRGSWGAYYRLLIPSLIDDTRSVYIDVDTVTTLDVGELLELGLEGAPAAFAPEGTVASTADASIRAILPHEGAAPYLNSGVMVVDHACWRGLGVTERCLELLRATKVDRHEQTALNAVLRGNWRKLEERFNFATNRRDHWPVLASSPSPPGLIIHFLDNPKPWDFLGERLHPHHAIWRHVLEQTAMRGFRTWHRTPSIRMPRTRTAWRGYARALKDRALFTALSRGWISRVKGLPPSD